MRHKRPEFIAILRKHERLGIPLGSALREVMHDRSAGSYMRGTAARVLTIADGHNATASLLDAFFMQTDKVELWETALTIEHSADGAVVPRLVHALYDANHDRRHAAARALGWIRPVSRHAAKALVRALLDKSQPQPVREEAAESLAYTHYAPAIPALISVLDEADVRMRFWAVFALGGIAQSRERTDPRLIQALERMLQDREVAPGNWWSVGREALAMLGQLEPQYAARLDSETRRVLRNPRASPEDLNWAKGYGV